LTLPAHDRAAQIFLQARRLDPAEREQYLRSACGDDGALLDEVESLLAFDDADDAPLDDEAPGAGVLRQEMDDASPLDPGARIGKYAIVRLIGQGGMGRVYEAQEEEPRRRVALKVIRPGLAAGFMVRRFRREVALLGRLRHPGIAQIYAAGQVDAGGAVMPWLAMELVEGEPIDAFVRTRKLDARGTLALVARACDAAEHAHQRGVVHRDLKPANILVVPVASESETSLTSADPAPGDPKILDFGIGRGIDEESRAGTLQTEIGQVLGTLETMSPEQATGDVGTVDARTDVYALGAILYALLAGRMPFDFRGRALPECLRTIAEVEPARLGSIDPRLRGDIETIVAKAMAKDRERRYASAAEFAADLRRFTRFEPVLARPASTLYQLRRFARRHRLIVTSLAGAFLVLLLGVIGLTAGLLHATEATREARASARRAERMNTYLASMLGWFSPEETEEKEVSLHDVLVEAERRLDEELADDPEIAATLEVTLAQGFLALDDLDHALDLLESARHTLASTSGERSVPLSGALVALATACRRADRFGEAEQHARLAVEIRRERLGDSAETAEALNGLAVVLTELVRFGEAEDLLREAIAMQRAAVPESEHLISGLRNLAIVVLSRGRQEEAESLLREALSLSERLGRGSSLESANLWSALAAVHAHVPDRAEQSIDALDRQIAILRDRLGQKHLLVLEALAAKAQTLIILDRREEATDLLRTCLAMALERDPLPAKLLRQVAVVLAGALEHLRRFDEAERVLLDEWQRPRLSAPSSMPRTAIRSRLVSLYRTWGREADAVHWEEVDASGW